VYQGLALTYDATYDQMVLFTILGVAGDNETWAFRAAETAAAPVLRSRLQAREALRARGDAPPKNFVRTGVKTDIPEAIDHRCSREVVDRSESLSNANWHPGP
jgi:hypothetical protein